MSKQEMTVLEYADLIIPGVKDTRITPQAVIKQINVSQEKKAGKRMRAIGLPKGVSAKRFGRFYKITVRLPKEKPINQTV